MNITFLFPGLLIFIFLAGCGPGAKSPKEVEGWMPIYQSDTSVREILSLSPRPIQAGGKIYVKGNTMYQVENGSGIHVFDIRKPEVPVKIAFLQIPGAQEISIKGHYLYSNNFNDLVIIDINDHERIRLLKRLANAFHLQDMNAPPESGYFECIDPSKGRVVGWERKLLHSPRCRY